MVYLISPRIERAALTLSSCLLWTFRKQDTKLTFIPLGHAYQVPLTADHWLDATQLIRQP